MQTTTSITYALFVGDKPSKTNTHPELAFLGAKCWPRLSSWIVELGVDFPLFVNRVDEGLQDYITYANKHNIPIVALGKQASKHLKHQRHFVLPHPSGLNRQLNNKEKLRSLLRICADFIKSSQ